MAVSYKKAVSCGIPFPRPGAPPFLAKVQNLFSVDDIPADILNDFQSLLGFLLIAVMV